MVSCLRRPSLAATSRRGGDPGVRRLALFPGACAKDPTHARVLSSLAGALADRGWSARVFCPRHDGLRQLRSFSPHVLNLHLAGHVSSAARTWTRALGGVPLVVSFQDLDHPDLPALGAEARSAVADVVRRARAVVALTPELAAQVRARFGRRLRVAAIGNGVDRRRPSPRRQRGGPAIAVARLAPYKGIDLLLWAFADLARERPRARLTIVGPDFQGGHYQRLARALGVDGRVRFAGRAEPARLRRRLPRARLFVSASRRETYGMAVLEAMAAGTPVIATRTGAAESLIRHGRSGWLVPPSDPKALSRALLRLWDDRALRARLSAEGRRCAQGHTWDERARRYDRLLRQALHDS